jgi:hypothetical protein
LYEDFHFARIYSSFCMNVDLENHDWNIQERVEMTPLPMAKGPRDLALRAALDRALDPTRPGGARDTRAGLPFTHRAICRHLRVSLYTYICTT